MTRRPLSPIWLAQPSRFASISPWRGRIGLVLIALLLLTTLLVFATPMPPAASRDPARRADDQADVVLYETIVEGVRHGGDYYQVAADAQRAGNYPLKPFVTFRLPTLAVVQGSIPSWATPLLLYALALAVFVAWYRRLAPVFSRPPPLLIAMALLAAGMMAFIQAELAPFHEIWAGMFVALSLAVRRPGAWLPAAAFGLVAVLIRETAAPYLALMAVMAWIDGQHREAIGWGIAITILGVVLTLHAHAVAQVVHPLDPQSPGWAGMLGFGFFIRTMTVSTALALMPLWLAAPLIGLSLVGWAAWRDPLGLRMVLLLAGYALVLSIFGRLDTFYWGLLVAPAMLVGLAFIPDGVRDLVAAAQDTRRITVTRVTR
jgi:hypothetical protein